MPRWQMSVLVTFLLILSACGRSSDGRAGPAPPPSPQQAQAVNPSHPVTTPGTSTAGRPGSPAAGGVQVSLPTPMASGCIARADALRPPSGYLHPEAAVVDGRCEAFIPVDSFHLQFALPASISREEALAALTVEGGAQPPRNNYVTETNHATLWLYFGPGPEGEEITARLKGSVAEKGGFAELGFRLKRVVSPTVSTELRVGDGSWQPLKPGVTVPAEPLLFRFRFTGSPRRELVEQRIRQALEPHKDATSATPFRLTWEEDATLLLSLPEPPPRLWIDFQTVTDRHGLHLRSPGFVLYTGMPPLLLALDPVTGKERLLGEAPVDIQAIHNSPDGKWGLLSVLEPDSLYAESLWLLETSTGEQRKTALATDRTGSYFWPDGRLVVPFPQLVQVYNLRTYELTRHPTQAERISAISPDGRYLAGFSLAYDREEPQTQLAPATIVVHDLSDHTERVYPDAARVHAPHNSSPPRMRILWEPDSGAFLYQEYLPAGERWTRLELKSGQFSPAPAPPLSHPDSPRVAGPTGWSYPADSWWDLTLRSPDGTEKDLGTGLLPLSWMEDGRLLLIRWSNWQHMRHGGL